MTELRIETLDELADLERRIVASANELRSFVQSHSGNGLLLLQQLKFDRVGKHPVDGHPLNAMEQLNQTWTYLVALAATRKLLTLHPDAGGFKLAPGANASQALDIMSVEKDLVGAETFAAVDHRNNKKLVRDINKLSSNNAKHRYVFFSSPEYPIGERRFELEKHGKDVQVWSVEFKNLLTV